MAIALETVEQATRRIAADILSRIEAGRPDDYEEQLRRDPLVGWTERGPQFLAKVVRFIDVYPAMRDDEELLSYLAAYVGDRQEASGLGSAGAIRKLIAGLQRRFTAGETLDEALAVCARLRERGLGLTLDVLGEKVVSEREAARYLQAYMDLFESAAPAVAGWPRDPRVDDAARGRVPRLNVSIKLSSLYHRFDPIDPRGSFRGVAAPLREVFRAARRSGAAVNVDMEHFEIKDLTLVVFRRVLTEDEFRDWPDASITIQTYLPGSARDLAGLLDWVERRGTPVNRRVVKGAYWDYEVQRAAYRNWPVPVYQSKAQTDADFEAACRFALKHSALLLPAIAGHNVRNVAHAIATAEALGLPKNAFEFQTLQGLGEELRATLVEMGCRVRVYVPFGGLVPGMAYLVRRLLEVTARAAFLRQMWPSPPPVEELVAAPEPVVPAAPAREPPGIDAPFRNEPVTDFARAEAREAMQRALAHVGDRLGATYPLWIGGKPVAAAATMDSMNPGRTGEVVGPVACATRRQVTAAMRRAADAFPGWAATTARERAAALLRTADLMRERRFELAAWEVMETAKSWREADADVAEAVDYLEFYAREAVRLEAPRRRDVHGERNESFYEPRGVVAVITPWNFPLAILTGVTSAALAAGNAAIMKPAEQSSVVAARLMGLWQEAGIPPGVVQYLPGRGDVAGEHLVRHPGVHAVAFTGSREVGLRIRRLAARTPAGQSHLKRVVAEMGGKNAVIVDRDADLDQAVPGIVASAFGYQGQKCSACSRVVTHRDVYDVLLERLVEATRSLTIGPAWDPHYDLGPLIDEQAAAKVRGYIAAGKATARLAYEADASALSERGHYVGPAIFADVDPDLPIAQEEIFGPVLCVIPARNFDEALAIANATPYGLTAGLYSRDPAHVERARRELVAGSVYVNRGITGALVDRQPFGGLKLSGIGSKAGGPDYLLQFMRPRTFTEYTVRRGFAPLPDEGND